MSANSNPLDLTETTLEELRAVVADLALQVSRFSQSLKGNSAPAHTKVGVDAVVDPSTKFMDAADKTITIGDRTKIYRGAEILGPVTIGQDCFINRDAYIRGDTHLGQNVRVGPFVRFITDSHKIGGPEKRAGRGVTSAIHVGDGVWIGASATILGGVTIGDGAIVAAGAVVNRDVAANTMVAGVPARFVKTLPKPQV